MQTHTIGTLSTQSGIALSGITWNLDVLGQKRLLDTTEVLSIIKPTMMFKILAGKKHYLLSVSADSTVKQKAREWLDVWTT